MAVVEYRAIATKTVVKDGEVYVTSACQGGVTVRLILGLSQLITIAEAARTDLLQIEGEVE